MYSLSWRQTLTSRHEVGLQIGRCIVRLRGAECTRALARERPDGGAAAQIPERLVGRRGQPEAGHLSQHVRARDDDRGDGRHGTAADASRITGRYAAVVRCSATSGNERRIGVATATATAATTTSTSAATTSDRAPRAGSCRGAALVPSARSGRGFVGGRHRGHGRDEGPQWLVVRPWRHRCRPRDRRHLPVELLARDSEATAPCPTRRRSALVKWRSSAALAVDRLERHGSSVTGAGAACERLDGRCIGGAAVRGAQLHRVDTRARSDRTRDEQESSCLAGWLLGGSGLVVGLERLVSGCQCAREATSTA